MSIDSDVCADTMYWRTDNVWQCIDNVFKLVHDSSRLSFVAIGSAWYKETPPRPPSRSARTTTASMIFYIMINNSRR